MQPSVLVSADPRFSPWVTPARLQERGALWIWQVEPGSEAPPPPPPLQALQAGGAVRAYQGQWQLPWPRLPERAPLAVAWRAYVPAACALEPQGSRPHG